MRVQSILAITLLATAVLDVAQTPQPLPSIPSQRLPQAPIPQYNRVPASRTATPSVREQTPEYRQPAQYQHQVSETARREITRSPQPLEIPRQQTFDIQPPERFEMPRQETIEIRPPKPLAIRPPERFEIPRQEAIEIRPPERLEIPRRKSPEFRSSQPLEIHQQNLAFHERIDPSQYRFDEMHGELRTSGGSNHRNGAAGHSSRVRSISSHSASSGSSGPGLPPGYWRTAAVPLACFVEEQLKGSDNCEVIDISEKEFARWSPQHWETWNPGDWVKEILQTQVPNTVTIPMVMRFGSSKYFLDGESKRKAIEGLHRALVKQFDSILDQIQWTMINDPRKAEWLRRYAKIDSTNFAAMRHAVFAEAWHNYQAQLTYLNEDPETGGIQFTCALACHQLVAAAQGINVWD